MISTTFSTDTRDRTVSADGRGAPGGHGTAFTLLEVTVMLVVLSVLGTLLVPASLKLMAARKVSGTQDEMREIFSAMTGIDSRSSFGFLGDVGHLPADLSELVTAEDYPLSTTDTAYQVRIGWNGPYAMKSMQDVTTDAFGRVYRFNVDDDSKLRSAGPDGQFGTDDDIVYPPTDFSPYGSVRIELDCSDKTEEDYTVRLYYSDSGEEKYTEASSAPYLFEDVHRGPHAVEVLSSGGDTAEVLASELVVLDNQTGLFRIDL